MNESIAKRAVMSSLYSSINFYKYNNLQFIAELAIPLKVISRKAIKLLREGSEETYSINQLSETLSAGIVIGLNGFKYVTELVPQDDIKGNMLKKLSRTVDRKTKSPKSSRGTVYRRNSTVIERRRQNPNWSNGSSAKFERDLQSKVKFTPLDIWLKKQKENSFLLRKQKKNSSLKMKQKRLPKENEIIAKLTSLSEKDTKNNFLAIQENIKSNSELGLNQPLLIIWGPPYVNQSSKFDNFSLENPEGQMMTQIKKTLQKIKEWGVNMLPIFLYADIYGIDIFNLNPQEVYQYEKQVITNLPEDSIFIRTSELIKQNSERYSYFKNQFRNTDVQVTKADIKKEIDILNKLGRSMSISEIKTLVYLYKLERLTEGKLLSEGFQYNGTFYQKIIKLGTAASKSRNDDPFEPELPRFYIKNMVRGAWAKPRK